MHEGYSIERKASKSPERDWHKLQRPPDLQKLWAEVQIKIGKAAQMREKQEWATKRPKLDTARRPRGIYIIDQDDDKHSQKCEEKAGSTNGTSNAVHKISEWHPESGYEGGDCIRKDVPKRCMGA